MIPVEVMIDSGAEVNCITVECWEFLKANKVMVKDQIGASQIESKLYAYGQGDAITIRGKFTSIIEFEGIKVETQIFVVENGAANILGRATCIDLDILRIEKAVNAIQESMPKMKDIIVRYNIDRRVEPVRQNYRRVAIHLAEAVEKEIDRLLRLDIIEKV